MSSLGSRCALSQKHAVGSNYLLLAKARMSGNEYGIQFLAEMLTKNRIKCTGTQSIWFSMYSEGNLQLVQEAKRHVTLVSTLASLSTFAPGAVKTSQTQTLAVDVSRQLLKDSGVDWDRYVTRAPNQHMDTGEVKEVHLKA